MITPSLPALAARWKCGDCDSPRSKPEKRMPTGWKRKGETVYCPVCWRKRYILRSITIAVAAPETGSWEELRTALRAMWIQTTQLSNWILTELYARDVQRSGVEKMPPMKPVYLYPEIRARFPALPSQTCAALEKAVTAKYRAKRYEVVWTCASALPTHRYPTPFPVPNQAWSIAMERDQPVVTLPVGGERVQLRLRGGTRYRRQLDSVRHIVAGGAEKGQLDIYPQGKDILCKIVAWMPRRGSEEKVPDNVLVVRSTAGSLIVALNAEDGNLWTYNADHVRRWSAEHRKQLQRWAEDSKAEHRPVPPFAERRALAALRYRRRMATTCNQIATMIAGYAVRRKFSGVRYDDRTRDFCPDFTWAALACKISEKCDEAGITFDVVVASADEAKETQAPLA